MKQGKPSMFAVVIDQYLNSPQFARLAEGTQTNWKRALLLAQKTMGHLSSDQMRPKLVQAHLDGLSDFPGKQETAKTALKAVEKWALVRDLLSQQITYGVETVGSDGGHEPWTDAEVALAVEHCRPDIGRAVSLAANTGQRRSDIIKMRWSNIELIGHRKGINVIQKKTGLPLWIPFLREFEEEIETWPKVPPFFIILAPNGRPFSGEHLSRAWHYERENKPELKDHKAKGLHFHGLRATAVLRLASMGFSELEIASFVGMSAPMVSRYLRKANRTKRNLATIERIENFRVNNVRSLRDKAE